MSTATFISRALQQRLDSARQLTDSIFSLLKPEAFYSRPIPERHRLVFYLGHLEAFDWNLICRKTLGVDSLSPQFDTLFEFGIDPPVGPGARRINRPIGRVSKRSKPTTGAFARASTSYSIRRQSKLFRSRSNIGSCTPRRWRTCCTICPTIKRCRAGAPVHSTHTWQTPSQIR